MKTIEYIIKRKLALSIGLALLVTQAQAAGPGFTTDISITNDSPDIQLNDSGVNDANWEICVDSDGCNTLGATGIPEGFHIGSKDPTTGNLAIQIENGAGTATLPLLHLDNTTRVGINSEHPQEELTINSPRPAVRLNDTSASSNDYNLLVDGDDFMIEDAGGNNILFIEGNTTSTPLWLDSDGDVGIQSANPSTDLVVGGSGQILMQNPSSTTNDWGFWSGTSGMWVSRSNNNIPLGTQVLKLQNSAPGNSLVLDGTGVGIGTSNPQESLHIRKTDAVLKVENTNPTTAVRTVAQLVNKGAVGFSMEDTDQAVTWDFRTSGTGNFIMNDVGDSAEVTILRNGNMNVKGNIVANGIALTSSRTAKTDILPVKPTEIMKKLRKVSLSEWRYKEAGENDRHISPMAEDFYSLFKLGPDNQHINPNDLASVAIIAAKELQKQSDLVKAENETLKKQLEKSTTTLRAENDQLQERLALLEKFVTRLSSTANTGFELKSKVVALK